jgi:hypothetical protein
MSRMNSARARFARAWWWGLVLLPLVAPGARAGSDIPSPRLAVVMVVDGLSPGAIDRVNDLFIGGFRRMGSEGAVLTDCHHDHAVTRTGPGYFVVLSGRHPGPAGIIENKWYDPSSRRQVYCVEDRAGTIAGDERPAGSYRNVFASALGDWLKQQRPDAQVVSIAGKDRAAIFMGGRAADGVSRNRRLRYLYLLPLRSSRLGHPLQRATPARLLPGDQLDPGGVRFGALREAGPSRRFPR